MSPRLVPGCREQVASVACSFYMSRRDSIVKEGPPRYRAVPLVILEALNSSAGKLFPLSGHVDRMVVRIAATGSARTVFAHLAYVFYDDDPVMPGGEDVIIGEVSIHITKHAVIKAELYSLVAEILADIEKSLKNGTEEAREKIIKRVFGKMALSMYDEGRLTLEQLNETLAEYQRGNFDYSPLGSKEGEKHGKHPETNE